MTKFRRTAAGPMMMSEVYSDHHCYGFGDFILDVERDALFCAGREVKLRPKAFDVLRYLVDHQGRLVSRDELHDAVWGTSVVTDDAITHCLIDIRKALSDSSQSIIRTIPRRGYIFELPVTPPSSVKGTPKAATRPAAARSAGLSQWTAGMGAVIVLGLFALLIPTTFDRPTLPVSDAVKPSIAVLPFAVLSDSRTQTYFADGVAEEIMNLLAREDGLRVIARTSSFSFRDQDVSISTVAEQLGVSHVLEGSFRDDGDEIRVNVQLVDANTGEYLWTESFDRTLSPSNIFAIQGEIASAVADSLVAELPTREQVQVARTPTDNLEALDAYFEGRAKMETRLPTQLAEASRLFEKAAELDPDFALPYVALADVCFVRAVWGSLPIPSALQCAQTAVEAAMAIDDQRGEAYLPLSKLLEWQRADLAGAEQALLKGIELSPNYAPLHQGYAELLSFPLARPHDALQHSRMSVALDPRSPIIMIDYARVLAQAGEVDQALEQVDHAIAMNPDLAVGYFIKAEFLHAFKGAMAEAMPLFEQAHRIAPQSPLVAVHLSHALIDLGYFDRARTVINETAPFYPEPSLFPQMRASMLIAQGDHAGAAEIARVVLNYLPNVPWALRIVRDQYIDENDHEKALNLYKLSYAELLDDSSEVSDLVGWQCPVAVDLSVLLLEVGRAEQAAKLLAAALDEANRRHRMRIGPPDNRLARIYAVLGDTDAAVRALQQAVDDGWRTDWHFQLYHEVAFDGLRYLPEFQAIVARVETEIEAQRRELEAQF